MSTRNVQISGIVLLCCSIGIGVLWWRSDGYADSLLVFLPSDRIQSVTSFQGRTQWMISNVSAGPQWEWSVDVMSENQSWDFSSPAKNWAMFELRVTVPAQIVVDDNAANRLFGTGFGAAGFSGSDVRIPGAWALVITMPHWLLIVLCMTVPGWQIRGFCRRRIRIKKGRCPACGYDLRASPERCPECGADAPVK